MYMLLIEDNNDIAASIYDYLEGKGHTMDAAGDGITGLHLAVTKDYDVIILDLGLPGIDGIDLCRRLREDAQRSTPILILTARDSLENKLEGFESGADDYLVKPFALQELAARVQALGKRFAQTGVPILRVADLILDESTHKVTRAGQAIELGPINFKMLAYFMRHTHRLINREELERAIWSDDPPDSDALRTHMTTLRQAIDKPFDRPLLHTIRGFGYRLADQDAL